MPDRNPAPRRLRISGPRFGGIGTLSVFAPDMDPGVEGGGATYFQDYVHTPTGEGPVWLEVTYDDTGAPTRTWYYLNSNGDIMSTTGNNVGKNTPQLRKQPRGTFHMDIDATGGDVTTTGADIIAAAIAAGAQLSWFDAAGVAQTRAVQASDVITRIDYDLKPIGGHGDNASTQVTSTASDATYTDGGGVTDVDPGGSRVSGNLTDSQGYYLPAQFVEATTKAGSIAVIGVDISGDLVLA